MTRDFSPAEIKQFKFFQYNTGNLQYFLEDYPSLDIDVSCLPHYRFARQVVSKNDSFFLEARKDYVEYLEKSWLSYGITPTSESFDEKVEGYHDHIHVIKSTGYISKPVVLAKAHNQNEYYLIDGNHRCSIATALKLPVTAKIISMTKVVQKYMPTVRHKKMKDAVSLNGSLVNPGRGSDAQQILNKIPQNLFSGKSVMDMGFSYGASALEIFRQGANEVLGLSLSNRLANFSNRLSALEHCYPKVKFLAVEEELNSPVMHGGVDVLFLCLDAGWSAKQIAKVVSLVRERVIFIGKNSLGFRQMMQFRDAGFFRDVSQIASASYDWLPVNYRKSIWVATRC